jgi:predicted membrane-bound spermidine synthase
MGNDSAVLTGNQRLPALLLYGVFFASGMAALLYQLVWQRALLTIYGTNIESVTMVVSAFMLGLGLGSLFGGVVSRAPGRRLLIWFAAIEIATGLYGAVSLDLFRIVGERTAGSGTWLTGVLAFALVLVPTLLMGSTLPLLVAFQVGRTGSVGRSVGMLYFVNTLGAAIGALLTVWLVFTLLGLGGSLRLAIVLNLVIGLLILGRHLRLRVRFAGGVRA